jgi:hypothetical protein
MLVRELWGGVTILEWAAKIAAACRCAHEVREFMFDPLVSKRPWRDRGLGGRSDPAQ